jgi:peptide/nickel transport system permease protein
MDTRDWYVLPRELPPSKDNLLGTTAMGRDVFWELASSVKNSLIIALITALVSVTVSLIIGLMAGLKAGIIDRILMFITDTFIIIPGLPLLIVVAAVLKAWMTLPMLGVLMALIAWPWPARQIRAIVLSLRERTFVYTAMLSGMGSLKILLREIMPYLIGWILVNFTNTILFSIGFESGLAMLGLSILGENTLGVMIYWALNYYALFRGILWWIIPPVVTLILIFISLYLISVGLSDYISPLRGE